MGGATPDETLLQISDGAKAKVLDFRSREQDAESLALWLEISGVGGGEYTYDMYLLPVAEATADDYVQDVGEFSVVVPAGSIEELRGARIELVGDEISGVLAVDNPNKPSPAVGVVPPGAGDLSGDVPQRVLQVLEHHINPMIAAHGGRADLVGVEGDTAYLRLSGGCQGCGMAKVTLGQGIEVAIKQAIPEITKIVDVTDHEAGTDPYFSSSKK
jgi:Fe/S biogenesis protein NfuA